MRHVLLLCVAICIVCTACDDKGEAPSGPGETCANTNDCEAGLKCLGLVCVADGTSGDVVSADDIAPASPDDVSSPPEDTLNLPGDILTNSDSFSLPYGPFGCESVEDCQPGEQCIVLCEPGGVCMLENKAEWSLCLLSAPGHWTDPTSGLTWQIWPGTITIPPEMNEGTSWTAQVALHLGEAENYCAQMLLDGEDDWRVPTIAELRTLVRGCPGVGADGECDLDAFCDDSWQCPDSPCTHCTQDEGPTEGCYWPDELKGTCSNYGSSSPGLEADEYWDLNFWSARLYSGDVEYDAYVRCVR